MVISLMNGGERWLHLEILRVGRNPFDGSSGWRRCKILFCSLESHLDLYHSKKLSGVQGSPRHVVIGRLQQELPSSKRLGEVV